LGAIRKLANGTGASVAASSKSCSSYAGCELEPAADAAAVAASADLVVAVVGLGNTEHEGGDRSGLTLPGCPGGCAGGVGESQTALLAAVRAAMVLPHQRLVLVLVSAGPVALTNVSMFDAVLYAGYGGQSAGFGAVDIMWGAVSPSGRFPLTVYEAAYPTKVGPILDYSTTSGVGRTYRYLNESASPPLFKFGFGLSYASFTYAALVISGPSFDGRGGGGDSGDSSGSSGVVTATVTVTNNSPKGSPTWGGSGATEIPQLYVTVPRQPGALPVPKLALQGFTRVQLQAATSTHVTFTLHPGQYCTVEATGRCTVFPGEYTIAVGGHQPGDVLGEATSNVVLGTFRVAAEDAFTLPRPTDG
jgi:beta-glucosidase